MASRVGDAQIEALASGNHHNPHAILGVHQANGRRIVRAMHPGADQIRVVTEGAKVSMTRIHPSGIFEAEVDFDVAGYELEITAGELSFRTKDPYSFLPVPGELDLYLFGEGNHHALWKVMGAHPIKHEGIEGTAFCVWAPNARSVRVVGDFNGWDGRMHPMRSLGASGVWELFIPVIGEGSKYKYEIITARGALSLKADPFAFQMELPPGTASIITRPHHTWTDGVWMDRRASINALEAPMSIYECHLGSWRRGEDGSKLSYREIAAPLADHVEGLGFTHVELLPVAEHPFGGSWGYQVSSYYSPTARFGSPDDFRFLVDYLHSRGIGVIIDWVPAHFPKDQFALAAFDGTALYEHLDPRKGEHPDWGTLVFNYGRSEVRNFLLANALYWLEEFHIDGLRVDAVASMLYLDYSRGSDWVPNQFGGRENLEAIDFLKDVNVQVHGYHPGAVTIAEESTAWPGVSRPTYAGGLGFTFKWNLGWMHDTLGFFSHDPVHRKYHHNELTFGLLYAFHENFILPLSHDEVVHGKASLLAKMPGDRWHQMANLRALYAWMWAHPGKKLLFMGGEIGQEAEWSHAASLDWHVLEWDQHRGIQELIGALNNIYLNQPALYEVDFSHEGFRWIDANDSDQNVFTFLRFSRDRTRILACLANLSPVARHGYRVGLPQPGLWREALSTDEARFGGSGIGGPPHGHETQQLPWHGFDQSVEILLPPLGVIWLENQ